MARREFAEECSLKAGGAFLLIVFAPGFFGQMTRPFEVRILQ